MANAQLGTVVHYLRRLVVERASAEQSDGQLLERFHTRQEADAFAALIRRHGPMVLGVCRRLLGDLHHAEDAFQATFLVLIRKSGSIRKRQSLGSWLHGVAYRIAVRARQEATQRRLQGLDASLEPAASDDQDAMWRDLRRVLDEELAQLPDKYRQPLVLCYLEGKTNEEAGLVLGWTKGTVSGRLARARDLLRSRLVRRGLTLAACGVAFLDSTLTARAAVPLALELSTIKLATLFAAGLGDFAAAGAVGALTEGVLQSMTLTKLKVAAVVLLVVGFAGSGAGLLGYQALGQTPAGSADADAVITPIATTDEPVVIARWTDGDLRSLAVSPDAKSIAVGSSDNVLRIWDLGTGQLRLKLPTQPVSSLAFSPDGRRLVSAADDRTVRLWTLDDQKVTWTMEEPQPVASVAFSPDGRTLVSGSGSQDEGGLVIWDAATGKKLRQLTNPGAQVRQVFFTPDGKLIIGGAGDGRIRLWDVASGKEVRALQQPGAVRAMAVSPDARIVASSGDQHVMLLDLGTGKLLATTKLAGGMPVQSLAFSPDGKLLAAACKDGTIAVLDVPQGTLRLTLRAHAGPAVSVTFTPDGQHIVAGSADKTVRLWKTVKGQETVKAGDVLARVGTGNVPPRLQSLVADLAKSQRTPDQSADALCLATLGRFPSETERKFMTDHLAKHKDNRQEAIMDVVWALINTKEFDAHVSELSTGKTWWKRDTEKKKPQ